MKMFKEAGKDMLKMSKKEWIELGKKAGWIKEAAIDPTTLLSALKMNPAQVSALLKIPAVVSLVTGGKGGPVDPQAFISALEMNPQQLQQLASMPEVTNLMQSPMAGQKPDMSFMQMAEPGWTPNF
jgi:hypothetical protein